MHLSLIYNKKTSRAQGGDKKKRAKVEMTFIFIDATFPNLESH
jgi:hypothetical protein